VTHAPLIKTLNKFDQINLV